ncbi:3-hydroxyacyl-CoA dehydrogenase family protein [Helcobacillus massiliensis]|uniref:3-hydroxybutyryl-CoA dehydrogenase n=1 Tax=Helcobacillus massiliensis TaxID=521392 RepID=A0A839QUA0_9MICO|nr:3-hydroxyacyl-CoA dehydrogenase family protein [Helcobacillus massiliensis]MBB3023652.1 3-hydroxybutyryl-CoA dehydrogenase [Helcobacillus massiliensis]
MTDPAPVGPTDTAALPRRVGVVGGGRMGAGIAHAFLTSGCDVTVTDTDQDRADAARERILASVQKSIDRGQDVDAADCARRLTAAASVGALEDRELVVEAVPEDWDLKVRTLQSVRAVLPAGAVLATNTSSLSVDRLAEHLEEPARFLGLHFFNPVPASTLIEVVLGERTDESTAQAARGWAEALGKTPVVVRDAPGFASSRLGVAIALEAMRMVEEGVASAEDVDLAMELGYRHPTGPLRTTDIVGLDVRLGIAAYLHRELGERFAPPQILRDKVARGELGRKTGKGFFDWPQ